jgi:hypothetical protein
MNNKRGPLKVLGYMLLGAGASFALMSGGNAYAFSLSPEQIIRRFMNQIVRYVAGDAMDTFQEAIENWNDKLKKLYGGESEDVTKKAAAIGISVNKAISIEEKIYNDNAMSDAMEIKTACRKSPGPVIAQAKEQLNSANDNMQDSAIRSSIEQEKRRIFLQNASEIVADVKQATETPHAPKIPKRLDPSHFMKDEGYYNEDEARQALIYVKTLTEYKRSTIVKAAHEMDSLNPAFEEQLGDDVGRIADVMNATAVINDIYLSRVRDRSLAQQVINRTTDGEASILKIHANDAGMSLIDVYNFEAEAAAFNHEYVKDIMTGKLEDNQENEAVIPSAVRGYKYLVQMKALENAFQTRLYEQQVTISKLKAILAKQKVRMNMQSASTASNSNSSQNERQMWYEDGQ